MGSDDLFKRKSEKSKTKDRELRKRFQESILIVCEGEKTEPNYFKSFPNSGIQVKVIGEGKNTNSLVEAGIKHWESLVKKGSEFENLFIVMDKDSFTLENYNKAFKTIKDFEIKINNTKKYKDLNFKGVVIYSNEAFELWYLLHYIYYDTAISREYYKELLTKNMGKIYQKNDSNIYNVLKEIMNKNQGLKFAINNAKKLREINKADINPSTNVDILVERLICKYCESKNIHYDKNSLKYF